MDELTLLRESRPQAAPMSSAARARARKRLLQEARRDRRRPGASGVVIALATLAALALVGHLTYVAVSQRDEVAAVTSPAPSSDGKALRELIAHARPAEVVVPPDDQYVYLRQKVVAKPVRQSGGEPRTYIDETWRSVDQSRPTRSSEVGRTWVTPPSDGANWPFPRDRMRELAGHPQRLLAAAAETGPGDPLTREAERTAYFTLSALLDPRQAAPADLRRTALEALAGLPDLRLRHGLDDANGRPAIGIRLAGPLDSQTTLLDPETVAFLGIEHTTAVGPSRGDMDVVTAVLEVAAVRQIGERP